MIFKLSNNKKNREIADVTVLEAGDIYKAGWKYNLIPFMAEVYNIGKDDQGLPFSYAVAVTKQRNNQ